MPDSKPLASLTSGLLARKGAAQPAMRRQLSGFGRAAPVQDDLGWNDMGYDPAPLPDAVISSPPPVALASVLTPMPVAAPEPAVVVERAQLAERIGAKPRAQKQPAGDRKAAFTLRLDGERHMKLRLASMVQGRSAQQIVTQALDAFLKELPEIDRLAKQMPRDRGQN